MKKLPRFQSEAEEAQFWQTHSPLDYPEEFNVVESPFHLDPVLLKKVSLTREKRKRTLTLRMGQNQIEMARIIAQWKGLGYQTQMRLWVIEGIRREIQQHPEVRKLLAPR